MELEVFQTRDCQQSGILVSIWPVLAAEVAAEDHFLMIIHPFTRMSVFFLRSNTNCRFFFCVCDVIKVWCDRYDESHEREQRNKLQIFNSDPKSLRY